MKIYRGFQSDDPRDRMTFVFHRTLFRRIFVGTFRKLLPIVINVDIHGLDNIPEIGPVIIASNHLTNFDVFLMQLVIKRPLFFMAKSEFHKYYLMDAALRSLGAFPFIRGKRDQWSMKHALKVLEHNQILAMFPEGTRSKGLGLKAGKTGVARLAINMECPIIPSALNGTHNMFKNFPKRTKISIHFGKPIFHGQGESTLGLTDRLMFNIADMLPIELRGVYAKMPPGFAFPKVA